MYRIFAFMLAAMLLFSTLMLGGCGFMRSSAKFVKKQTEPVMETINPEPEIDLDDIDEDEDEMRLARLFAPVDGPIQHLVQSMSSQEAFPDPEWFARMRNDYPWLDVVASVNTTGRLAGGEVLRPIDEPVLENLLEGGGKRGLRSHVVVEDDAARIYLANPFTVESEWRGLNLVSFDLARLVRERSPQPRQLGVFTPQKIVWSGKWQPAALPLYDHAWDDILEDDIEGEMEWGDKDYVWIVRYLGQTPVIYMTEALN